MIRLLKQLILSFKPLSDEEVMRMNLDGPKMPAKKKEPSAWEEVAEYWRKPGAGE